MSHVKPKGGPIMSTAALCATIEKLRKLLSYASHVIDECDDVLSHYEDVRDGADGPSPNEAMHARMSIGAWRSSNV